MFFLIRCVFWLWVVFSTIFSQTTADSPASRAPDSPRHTAMQPLAQTAQTWLGTAAGEVANRCAAAPAACLAIASQLSQLATSQQQTATEPARFAVTPARPVVAPYASVPLPPRRPSFGTPKEAQRLDKTARREYFIGQVHAEADF